MKNKLFWLIIILTICAIAFSLFNNNSDEVTDFKPLEINVGDVFDYLEYENKMYILNYTIKDITGDGTNDMVLAIGEKEKIDDTNVSNVDLVLYEPNLDRFYILKLKNLNGSMPKIETMDLTGDGVQDAVLSISKPNGEIELRIGSFSNEQFKEIMRETDNKGIIFEGQMIDGFKANISCKKYDKKTIFDLSDRKENYVTSGFYDESGRLLKKDSKIMTSKFVSYEFVQLDGYYGIQTMQRILGFNNEDLLDEITTIWKYENGKWIAKEAKGNNWGNLLY